MKTMTKSRLDSRLELVSKQSVFVGSSLMRCWRRPVAWQQKQWEIFDWQYMSICNIEVVIRIPIPPCHQFIHFLEFFGVFKEVKKAMVKRL